MKVVKNEVRELVVETTDENFINPLIETLLRDTDVKYAGKMKEHPLTDTIHLIVRTKNGTAEEALDRAINELGETFKKLREELAGA
jgi:DNA-directed RNA polymerase subunit L